MSEMQLFQWVGGLSKNQLKAAMDFFDSIPLGDLPPATSTAIVRLSDPDSWEEISFVLRREDAGQGTRV